MSRVVSIKTSKINIFSILSFFILTPIFIFFQTKLYPAVYINADLSIIMAAILIPFFHEFLHFFGFIFLGKLKPKQLRFGSNKSSPIPYFSTDVSLSRNKYILILLLPCIILSFFSIIFSILSSNLFYSFLIGYSVSISAGDLLLVKELFQLHPETNIIPLADTLGFNIV